MMITPEYLTRLEEFQYFISIEDSLRARYVNEEPMLAMLRHLSGNKSLDYLIDHHVFIRIKKSEFKDYTTDSGIKISIRAWLEPKHATFYRLNLNNNDEYV
jgi:hypothetical protein